MKGKKLTRKSAHSESGVILPIVLILMLALTITGLAFLNAGVMENSLVRRQIHKNQAFYLAEAGVEHARVKLGQDWEGWLAYSPISATLGAGAYNADIDDKDSSEADLPWNKRRVTSTGTVGEISKTVEVILRKPPTGSGEITSVITAGGVIDIKGAAANISPQPSEDDENVDFSGKFEEIFGVSKDEMKDIAQSSPNIYYDSAIGIAPYDNPIMENITWVDGIPNTSTITATDEPGKGILIVRGDLNIAGGSIFYGIIWVIGELQITGNAEIYGSVFAECGTDVDTTIAGNPILQLSPEAIDEALGNLGVGPVVESWQEI